MQEKVWIGTHRKYIRAIKSCQNKVGCRRMWRTRGDWNWQSNHIKENLENNVCHVWQEDWELRCHCSILKMNIHWQQGALWRSDESAQNFFQVWNNERGSIELHGRGICLTKAMISYQSEWLYWGENQSNWSWRKKKKNDDLNEEKKLFIYGWRKRNMADRSNKTSL